jgi:uncharacterized membrane protein
MTEHGNNLRAAAMLGGAGGLRTFTPAATLAAHGRLPISAQQRKLLITAAVGELIGDKLPWVPARTAALPYLGRAGAGLVCGGVVAGRDGALAGAATAAVTTIAGYQCRRLLTQHTRMPATLIALLEDALAVGVANHAATQSCR